jgi:hypothetical protein
MIEWIKTNKHVYDAIYRQHETELTVFTILTDPDGVYGPPSIETVWGFKGADYPLIKSVGLKFVYVGKIYKYEYYIARVKKEPE